MEQETFKNRVLQVMESIPKDIAYLITNRHNINYLTSFTGTHGWMLLTNKKSYLITDTRYIIQIKTLTYPELEPVLIGKTLAETIENLLDTTNTKTIFFESANLKYNSALSLIKALSNYELIGQNSFIENKRIIKDSNELNTIKEGQKIAERVFLDVKNNLQVNQSEKEIAWQIELLAHKYGADTISFPPIVAINEHSASPHHMNTDRKIKSGDFLMIDMGIRFKEYCTDMTRMIFTGDVPKKQEKAYNTVLKAQIAALNFAKPDINANELDNVARDIINSTEFKDSFTHALGHGVGIQIHEAPSVSSLSSDKLLNGTLITVEPGIYIENEFGIRIEDMLYIDYTNNVNLTSIPKDLESAIKVL